MRHSTLLEKAAKIPMEDEIYNWLVSYFKNHEHSTKFNNSTSKYQYINSSVIQGSAIGPIAFVITASDLTTVHQENALLEICR